VKIGIILVRAIDVVARNKINRKQNTAAKDQDAMAKIWIIWKKKLPVLPVTGHVFLCDLLLSYQQSSR